MSSWIEEWDEVKSAIPAMVILFTFAAVVVGLLFAVAGVLIWVLDA